MDKREYLRSKGFTVGDRGRFSAEMQAALAAAPAGSFTEPVKPEPKAKSVSAAKPAKTVKVEPAKSTADPKAVRQWAKDNGHQVGDRGRIRPEVFAAYEAAKADKGEVIEERKRPEVYTGPTAPMLTESDAKWGFTDPKGKKWTVGVRTACANTGVSLGWCPESTHRVVIGDVRQGLVSVSRI